MPKKKLNTEAITNELQHSAFFPSQHFPTPTPTEKAEETLVNTINSKPKLDNQIQTEAKIIKTERNERTVEPNARTDIKQDSTLLDEITEGVKTDKRLTERYSFEIYSDQIPQIEELQYLYKKRTGQKLPASRILREALEVYLRNAFEALKRKK